MAKAVGEEFTATGRRKTSVARVRIKPGSGRFVVNGRSLESYFTTETMRLNATDALTAIQQRDKWDVFARLTGGGVAGQAGALRLGIARALVEADPELKPTLKSGAFLTRDPRMKERKKYGQPGARKRFQFSKR